MLGQKHFGLIGAGGFARELMPFVPDGVARQLGGGVTIRFVVPDGESSGPINGVECIEESRFLELPGEKHYATAIAGAAARRAIDVRLDGRARPLTLIAPQALIYPPNEIAAGSVFCAFTHVTANARIGRSFHCNIYSYVAHDCIIGDYVTFAPSVQCNGNVHVGDGAYVGTGAVLKQGSPGRPLVIGEGAVVGMGAVVTKDVPPGVTVVGNPARPFEPAR